MGRGEIAAANALAIACIMFKADSHFCVVQIVLLRSLQARNNGVGGDRNNIGVFAPCFFSPAPARVGADIDIRRKTALGPSCASLGRRSTKDLFYQRRVKGAGHRHSLRKLRRACGEQSV